MRTTHKLNLTTGRTLGVASVLLVLAGLVFAFAPMRPVAAARQALAARVNASPTANKILSVAPAPMRSAIKKRLATAATPAAAMFAPYTVDKTANPADGSTVGQGQTVTYTITITNTGATDTTAAGGFIRMSDNQPPNVTFSNPTVVTQPATGTAWACVPIPAGGGNLACQAGGFAGGDTFVGGEFVVLQVTATVNNNAPAGGFFFNTATFEFDVDGVGGVAPVVQNSNTTTHFISSTVDLAISKFSQSSQPGPPAPANGVLAGGNSVTLTSVSDVGNEGRGNLSYVLEFSNLGSQNAVNVTIEDTVPAGPARLQNAPPPPNGAAGIVPGPPTSGPIITGFPGVTAITINGGGNPDPSQFRFNCGPFGVGLTVTCTPADNTHISGAFGAGILPAGFRGRFAYRIAVNADAVAGNIVSNQARINTNGSTDTNASNNTSLPTQNVIYTQADAGIFGKTVSPTTVVAGSTTDVVYTIRVGNNGPSQARDVVVTDPLPSGLVFQSVSVAPFASGGLIPVLPNPPLAANPPVTPPLGFSCAGPAVGTNGTITCTGDILGPDPATSNFFGYDITIVARVAATTPANAALPNTASVASSTLDPGPTVNTGTASLAVTVNAPLTIAKAGPATLCAGDTFTYNITVTNGGASTATGVTVQDTLPANTTFLSLSATNGLVGKCSHNGGAPGTVTCSAADLASGNHELHITAKLAANAPSGAAALSNSASITACSSCAPTVLPVTSNTVTTAVNHCSDLEITKDDSPDAVKAGDDINYTITVKNNGPSDIDNIPAGEFVVNDAIPPTGTTLKGTILAPGFDCNGGTTFPCTATAPLPAGASVQIKFTVTVLANFNNGQPGGAITNTATVAIGVGSSAIDANSQNNSSTVNTPVGPSADLAITKQAETVAGAIFGATVIAGGTTGNAGGFVTGTGEILYTLSYRNNGLGDATNVHIRDVIPGGTLLIPNPVAPTITQTGAAVTCSAGLIAGIPSPTYQIDCTPTAAGGILPAGASGTIAFSVRVPENVPEGTIIKNQATINSEGTGGTPATPDPSGGNNTSAPTQNVVRTSADLEITKALVDADLETAGVQATAVAGRRLSYTVTVSNHGPSDARQVVITDALPAGVSFVSAASDDASAVCTNAGNTVTCQIPLLIPRPADLNPPPIIPARAGTGVATITIVGRVDANNTAASLSNIATVAAATQDPVAANNTSNAGVPVVTPLATSATFSITKTSQPEIAVAGENVTHTIKVTNTGPSDAQGVVITDEWAAAQFQFISVTATGILGNGCTGTNAPPFIVTCTPPGGVFPANTMETITVVFKVNPDAGPNQSNTARVVSTTAGNAVAPGLATTLVTAVQRRTEVAVTKDDSPDAVNAGNEITYTIRVINNGSSTVATGELTVTDPLPAAADASVVAGSLDLAGAPDFAGCTLPGTLATGCANVSPLTPGEVNIIRYRVLVNPAFLNGIPINQQPRNLTNIVSLTGAATTACTLPAPGPGNPSPCDPNTSNNVAVRNTPVGTLADLQLAKTAAPGSVIAGGTSVALPAAGGTGDITYTITYRNNGPAEAAHVRITDNIPANVIFVNTEIPAPVAGAAFTCNAPAPGTQLICMPAGDVNLASGANGTIRYRVRVPANVLGGTLITNNATIASTGQNPPGTPDPNIANNSQSTSTLVISDADLTIGKTAPATATAGGADFNYVITVTNPGPSDAQNVVVTDPLPAGILFGSASATNGFNCVGPPTNTNGVVTCSKPVLAAGGSTTITIVARVAAGAASGARVNTATVNWEDTDADADSASASATTTVLVDANVTATKTDTTDPVVAGANLTYQISLTNSGPSLARAVTLTDTLPPNTSFVSLNGTGLLAGCTHNGATPGVINCGGPATTLGAGETNNLTVVVKVDQNATGTLTNTLAGTFQEDTNGDGTFETVAIGGDLTEVTAINRRTDVAVTKNDSPDAVQAGNEVTYTLTVTNNGPSTVFTGEVTVTDLAPPASDASLVAGSLDLTNASDFTGCTLATLTAGGCANASAIQPGEVNIIRYRVLVNPSFTNGIPVNQLPRNLVNIVTLSGAATTACPGSQPVAGDPVPCDPNTTNNSATRNTPVGPNADLQLTKTADPASVLAGGTSNPLPGAGGTGDITFTITYRNSGPSDAKAVRITDTIPANTVFVGFNIPAPGAGPTFTCSPAGPAGSQFTCMPTADADLPVGANGTIQYRVRVLANIAQNTVITNSATITSTGAQATPDPNTSNNTQGATSTLVNTSADLSIVKTLIDADLDVAGVQTTAVAGHRLSYSLVVTNGGVSDAQNVVVTDALDARLSYISATSTDPGFACTNTNNTVTCTKPTLAAGASTTITIEALVKANTTTSPIPNTATVASTTPDPVPGNNTSSITTPVVTSADLTLVKTDNPDPVVAGTNLTYTLTLHNNGPSDAQSVVLTDTLPPTTQVSFVSVSGTGVFSSANSCVYTAGAPPAQSVVCTANPAPGPNQGVMPAGASATVTIVVKVLPNVPSNTTLTNSATATSTTPDPNTANNTGITATTLVIHNSDMSIRKQAPDFGIAGSRYDIRLIVANNGPSDVLGDAALPGSIVVWDLLPVGTSLAAVTPNPFIAPGGPGNFACRTVANQGPASNQTLVLCYNAADAAGNFPAGANIEIIIKVDTNSNLVDGSNLYNCAQVTLRNTDTTPEVDPLGGGQHNNTNPAVGVPGSNPPGAALTNASGNNESCDGTVVRRAADLAVSKSSTPVDTPPGSGLTPVPLPTGPGNVPPNGVSAGGYIRYDVPFGNNGPSDAVNVLLSNVVPGNTAYVGALQAGGTFTASTTFNLIGSGPGANLNIRCDVTGLAGSQLLYCRPTGNGALPAPGPYADGVLPASYSAQLTYFVKVNESVAGGTVVSDPAIITSGLCPNPPPAGFPPVPCASTPDPNTSNNTSQTTQNVVVQSSQLTISKIVQSAVTTAAGTGPFGPPSPSGGAATTTFANLIGLGSAPNTLVRLSSSTGATIGAALAITGLVAGDTVVSIDVRPATGQLYALGVNGAGTVAHLYTLNTTTGAATQVGGNITLPQSAGVGASDTGVSIDFNPVVDRIRVVSRNRDNFRLHPDTGAVAGADTALTAGSDVADIAYDRNFATATQTTLFGIDPTANTLVRIGDINGTPNSPNTGIVATVGALGVDPTAVGGFDILNDGAGSAQAALTVGGVQGLYSINLTTGAATLITATGGAGSPVAGLAATAAGVIPGTTLTYRVRITNNGPSDVSNVRFTDTLPSGLETPPGRVLGARYVSVTQNTNDPLARGATFTCFPPTGINPNNNPQQNGGAVQCTAPLLAANAPNNIADFDVVVFIDPATKAPLVDTARVDATINNFNQPTSASTMLTTPVAPTSDLAVTKTHTNAAGVVGGDVTAGTVFTYTITLTNNGSSAAQMVRLVDTLPAFQQVRSIQVQQTPNANGAPNVTCTASPNTLGATQGTGNNTTSVTCTAAELPPNRNADGTANPSGTVTITLTVRQDEATVQPGGVSFQNCVTALSMSADPVLANSTNVCDAVNVVFAAAAVVTKVATPVGGVAGGPVIAGNNLVYTITATNPGPSAALNFRITDVLPAGVFFLDAVASAGATLVVAPAGQGTGRTVTATWDAAGGTPGGLTLPGVTRTLTITVRVCPDFFQIVAGGNATACTPALVNTANVTSDTTTFTPGSATSTTTVQAQSDLSIVKTGPASAIYSTSVNASIITYTLTINNAGPSNASGVTVTDVLPKGFTLSSFSVTPALNPPNPAPSVVTTTDAAGVQTNVFSLGVIGAANQCGPTIFPVGPITLTVRALIPIKFPTIPVTNTATVATTNCLPDPNLANNTSSAVTNIGPPITTAGLGLPARSEISDDKEGSILFFPIYTSDAANPNSQNTRIAITNTSTTEDVTVHLYVVDGSSCTVLDAFICLTQNQTTTFLASDFDPGATGYIMAVAVDDNTGLPRAFNELIGDEYVKFASGHRANLGAEAVAATMFFPAGTNANATTATLRFDGMSYNRLPRVLALDNIGSRADQNDTLLIVDSLGGDFTRAGATLVGLFGFLYDDAEVGLSFTQNVSTCQFRTSLSNTFPRLFNGFNNVIPAGRTGWMKFWSNSVERPIIGAAINHNPNLNSNSGAFVGGHNLHKLTLTDVGVITVPILPPACQ